MAAVAVIPDRSRSDGLSMAMMVSSLTAFCTVSGSRWIWSTRRSGVSSASASTVSRSRLPRPSRRGPEPWPANAGVADTVKPSGGDMREMATPIRVGIAAAVVAMIVPAAAFAGQGQVSPCSEDRGGDRPAHCEVREFTVPAAASLVVNASPNGGVTVGGWDRQEIRVRARVVARAETQAEADQLAAQVKVVSDGGSLRAEGPRRSGEGGWSVSFELMVPARTGLDVRTTNGGITVRDVHGQIGMTTTNGGITLENVDGDVRGETTNGGVRATLGGSGWQGQGLDLRTRNGGVRLLLPDGYSAHVEAGTTNGGISCSFPVTVQGSISRQLSADIGGGGATLTLRTTNGGISIGRK
jgi:hypothetical protein